MRRGVGSADRRAGREAQGSLAGLHDQSGQGEVRRLRFYANAGAVDEATGRQFYALIREAEARSYEICERCGRPGRLSRRGTYGWYKTLCSTCAGKFSMEPVNSGDDEVG